MRLKFWNTVMDFLIWLDHRIERAYERAYAKREAAK
jgi:hypothetical protein